MHTKGKRLLLLLLCLGCLFLCSCGLDDYYVIEPPVAVEVPIGTLDPDKLIYAVSCPSVNSVSSSQISMKGTAIYYKWYSEDDYQQLDSDIKAIKASNTEYSENGINRVKNLSYTRMLFYSGSSVTEFLQQDTDWIMIRAGTGTEVGTITPEDNTTILKTLTAISSGTTYDVYVGKPSSTGGWYLNAYAVTVGDVSLQEHYSQLAPLGVLPFMIESH